MNLTESGAISPHENVNVPKTRNIMTDTEKKQAEAAAAGEVRESASAPAEAANPAEEAPRAEGTEGLAAPSADIERLEAEKADLTDRLLRLAADMDNLRRRSEREVADARKYAVARFAGDMLVVGDNLRRALEAIPPEIREAGDAGVRAFIEGVEMTGREMDRLLEKNGVTKIAAKGERFDPNRHQAMFEVPDSTVPAGTVVQVMQDGYTIGDRVLRAALVGVAKEAPKEDAEPAHAERASGEAA